MVQFHTESQALATLAVQDRETSRYLLFDEQLSFAAGATGSDQQPEMVRGLAASASAGFFRHPRYFSALLAMMTEEGAFSIITSYLRLAGAGREDPRLSRR